MFLSILVLLKLSQTPVYQSGSRSDPSDINPQNGIGVPNFLWDVTNGLDSKCDQKVKRMWRTDSNRNMIKKVKHTFPGASYPYTLRERIQINGRRMDQIQKRQYLTYLNLSL